MTVEESSEYHPGQRPVGKGGAPVPVATVHLALRLEQLVFRVSSGQVSGGDGAAGG